MRFLLDENVHKGLFKFLKERDHDVIISPKRTSDFNVFQQCIKEERILITRDADFLEDKFTKENHFGILLIRIKARDIDLQIKALTNLLSIEQSFENKIIKITSESKFEFL